MGQKTPDLAHLMGAYFHQDWYEEHRDAWANLHDFLTGEPLAVQLPAEVDTALHELTADEEVGRYLESLGSCHTPTAEQGGYRAWLQEVGRRARAHVGGEGPRQ